MMSADSSNGELTPMDLKPVLAEVVEMLPDDERQVIEGLYWERISLAEIGERLGVGKGKALTLRDRAFRRIKRLLKEANGG